jgi:hypothetical protein
LQLFLLVTIFLQTKFDASKALEKILDMLAIDFFHKKIYCLGKGGGNLFY